LEGKEIDKVSTICPYCGCGCGLYLHVENGNIIGVSPIRNHPVNKGSLCVKGWNCFEFIQHTERLKRPLIRIASKEHSAVSSQQSNPPLPPFTKGGMGGLTSHFPLLTSHFLERSLGMRHLVILQKD
jgi:hypothetical protein